MKTIKRIFLSFSVLSALLICTVLSVSAVAQDQSKILPRFWDKTEYHPPIVENLAGLYWMLGAHDLEDDEAVDRYLMITNCPLFTDFYVNAEEWPLVREGGRKELKKLIKHRNFVNNYRFVIPVGLTDYDSQAGVFRLASPYDKLNGRKYITQLQTEPSSQVCGVGGKVKGYPKNLLVKLGKALPISEFTVDQEKADLYLQAVENSGIGRIAYLTVEVRVIKFMEFMNYEPDGTPRAHVFGRLEGVGLYADQELGWQMSHKNLDPRL